MPKVDAQKKEHNLSLIIKKISKEFSRLATPENLEKLEKQGKEWGAILISAATLIVEIGKKLPKKEKSSKSTSSKRKLGKPPKEKKGERKKRSALDIGHLL